MPKTKVQKKEILDELVEKLGKFKAAVFTDYKGLTVAEAKEVRKMAKKQNAEYIVAKKTLIQKALEQVGIKDIDVKKMQGNVSLIIGFEDEIGPAKVAAEFGRKHESLKMIGGIMENKFIDLDQVIALSKIPPKMELLTQLVGSLQSPIRGFATVLAGNLRGLLTALNAIKEQKV
ncbi:MAG: 50S ribosomal protein L10 [Patescibacteria group bacterium]|nr:50S ribosomal protein L10 [Patescibacteria group bacterium]